MVRRKWYFLSVLEATWVADQDGKTSLHIAAQSGDLEVLQCLLESGANTNGQGVSN